MRCFQVVGAFLCLARFSQKVVSRRNEVKTQKQLQKRVAKCTTSTSSRQSSSINEWELCSTPLGKVAIEITWIPLAPRRICLFSPSYLFSVICLEQTPNVNTVPVFKRAICYTPAPMPQPWVKLKRMLKINTMNKMTSSCQSSSPECVKSCVAW